MGTKLLEIGIGRGLGALKELKKSVQQQCKDYRAAHVWHGSFTLKFGHTREGVPGIFGYVRVARLREQALDQGDQTGVGD